MSRRRCCHDTKPLLILAEGQSNMMTRQTYSWSPPENLLVWDWYRTEPPVTAVGTQFLPASSVSNVMSAALSFAAEFATENPDRLVYLVNISLGAQPIARWLPGSPAPDMYAATKANIEAALAVIGEPVDLLHYWWQGESDAMVDSQTYVSDFMAHRARKKAEAWYPITTPMVVMGITPFYSELLIHFNRRLCEAVSLDRLCTFVETSVLPQWCWPDNLHMNAEGYEVAGKLAFNTLTKANSDFGGAYENPSTGHLLRFPYLSTFRYMRGGGVISGPQIITGWNVVGGPNPGNRFDPPSGAFAPAEDGLYHLSYSVANCPAGGGMAISLYKGDAAHAPYQIPGTQTVVTAAYASASHSTVLYLRRGEYVQLHLGMGTISSDPNVVSFSGYLVG